LVTGGDKNLINLQELANELSKRLDRQADFFYERLELERKRTMRQAIVWSAATAAIVVVATHFLMRW
jgi:hypothetical protein